MPLNKEIYVYIGERRKRKEDNVYIYEDHLISFQIFFRMGTFIDSTHMKL